MLQQRLPSTIYHIAEESNWPFIQRHGLLSARVLLEQAELSVQERSLLEQQRTQSLTLPGGILIRDQRPMPSTALERCLHEMTSAQWYALLNARVFFWLDPERLNRMRGAMKERPQVVLSIDTERLLARYAEQVTLTPINTGNARRQPARRGAATFVPYTTWLSTYSNQDYPVPLELLGDIDGFGDDAVDLAQQGVIPIMVENQNVCIWALRLDGTEDPPVVVSFGATTGWQPYAERFSTFVYVRIWDYQGLFSDSTLWGGHSVT